MGSSLCLIRIIWSGKNWEFEVINASMRSVLIYEYKELIFDSFDAITLNACDLKYYTDPTAKKK